MSLFTLTVEKSFSAALYIPNYPGPCGRMHGHHYGLKITVTSGTLNQHGMLIDYHHLDKLLDPLIAQLDHCTLNELPAFKTLAPTTENLAKWCFDSLQPLMAAQALSLEKIVLIEDQKVEISYAADQAQN